MAIRGILFDLDGTLFAREAAFWSWLREEELQAERLRGRAGATPLDWARVAELDRRGHGPKPALLEYLALALNWPERSLESRMDRLRRGVLGQVRCDERVVQLLRHLRTSFRLGLVTNGSSIAQRSKLRSMQIEALLDPIVVSAEVGHRKPEFAIFRLGTRNWGLPHGEILFVGDDAIRDIGGARGAGMRTVQVLGEPDPLAGTDGEAAQAYAAPHQQEPPEDTAAIASVLELESWLRQHALE